MLFTIFVSFVGFLVIYISIILLYPYKTVEYNQYPLDIKKDVLRPGDRIPIEISTCTARDLVIISTPQLVPLDDGDDFHIYERLGIQRTPGCRNVEFTQLTVPSGTNAGRYKIVFSNEIHILNFGVRFEYAETEPFTVTYRKK